MRSLPSSRGQRRMRATQATPGGLVSMKRGCLACVAPRAFMPEPCADARHPQSGRCGSCCAVGDFRARSFGASTPSGPSSSTSSAPKPGSWSKPTARPTDVNERATSCAITGSRASGSRSCASSTATSSNTRRRSSAAFAPSSSRLGRGRASIPTSSISRNLRLRLCLSKQTRPPSPSPAERERGWGEGRPCRWRHLPAMSTPRGLHAPKRQSLRICAAATPPMPTRRSASPLRLRRAPPSGAGQVWSVSVRQLGGLGKRG